MAGAVAGAFDIDVVALAPEQHPSRRVLATLRTVVSGWSEASRVHLEAILGKTGGVAAAVPFPAPRPSQPRFVGPTIT